jgi:hypothetical protein
MMSIVVEGARLGFRRLFLLEVAHGRDLLVLVDGVVVEGHLTVERQHAVVGGNHQRVDLDQRRVQRHEGLVQLEQEGDRAFRYLALQAQGVGQVAGLVGRETDRRVHMLQQNSLGGLGRHLLDLHATRNGGHHDNAALRSIDQYRCVQLARDGHALLDEQPLDDAALETCLMGDQFVPKDLGLRLPHRRQALDHLDTAALAPATGVNLRLHDHGFVLGCLDDLLRRGHRPARFQHGNPHGHRQAESGQEGLCLVFVNLHRVLLSSPLLSHSSINRTCPG